VAFFFWSYAEPDARTLVPREKDGNRNSYSRPTRQDCLGISRLDLFAKTAVIETHQHIVPFVGGAANRITHEDHAVAHVHRTENRRQDADIGLRPRDDQRISPPLPQMREQSRPGKSGIAHFVDDRRRRAESRKGGISSSKRPSRHSRVALRQRV